MITITTALDATKITFRKNGLPFALSTNGYVNNGKQEASCSIEIPNVGLIGDEIKLFGQVFKLGTIEQNNEYVNGATEQDTFDSLTRAFDRNYFLSGNYTWTISSGIYQINLIKKGFDDSYTFAGSNLLPKNIALTSFQKGSNGSYNDAARIKYSSQQGLYLGIDPNMTTQSADTATTPLLNSEGLAMPLVLDFQDDVVIEPIMNDAHYYQPTPKYIKNYALFRVKAGDNSSVLLSDVFTILDGKAENPNAFLQSSGNLVNPTKFLNERILKRIGRTEGQSLYYFIENKDALPIYRVVVEYVEALGTTSLYPTMNFVSNQSERILQIPVSPLALSIPPSATKYRVFIEFRVNAFVWETVSEIKTFIPNIYSCDTGQEFIFKNAYGMYDVINFEHLDNKQLSIEKESFDRFEIGASSINTVLGQVSKTVNEKKEILRYESLFHDVEPELINFFKSFLLSDEKYIKVDGRIKPFQMINGSYDLFQRGENLRAIVSGVC